jgi:hypothetical protein
MNQFQGTNSARLCNQSPYFKHLWSPGIDSKEWIPPAYVASRAGYDNPIPTRFLAPVDCLKIPALAGRYDNPIPARFLAPIDCLKIPAMVSESGT